MIFKVSAVSSRSTSSRDLIARKEILEVAKDTISTATNTCVEKISVSPATGTVFPWAFFEKCDKCGTPLFPGAKFCPNCGIHDARNIKCARERWNHHKGKKYQKGE